MANAIAEMDRIVRKHGGGFAIKVDGGRLVVEFKNPAGNGATMARALDGADLGALVLATIAVVDRHTTPTGEID